MDFVYRILQILKALWIILSQTIYNLRNLQKQKILGSKLFPPPPPGANLTIGYVHRALPLVIIHCLPSICHLKWF